MSRKYFHDFYAEPDYYLTRHSQNSFNPSHRRNMPPSMPSTFQPSRNRADPLYRSNPHHYERHHPNEEHSSPISYHPSSDQVNL